MAAAPPIKGIIFDLDNTLFRCGPRYYSYYALTAAIAATNLGLKREPVDLIDSLRETGAAGNEGVAQFAAAHGLPEKSLVHEFNAVAGRMFSELIRNPDYAEKLPGLPDLLAATTLPKAVITRGPRAWIEPVIAELKLSSVFEPSSLYPAGDESITGRRSCETYLKIANDMNVQPDHVAVVDDVADNFLIAPSVMWKVLVNWDTPLKPQPPHVNTQVRDVRYYLRNLNRPGVAP